MPAATRGKNSAAETNPAIILTIMLFERHSWLNTHTMPLET